MTPEFRNHLCHIDCTTDLPSETYFDTSDVAVVNGPAGRYRQAAAKPLSRFGYRFSVENVGRPHIIVNDGTTYDVSTGVYVTGCESTCLQ